MKEIIIKGARTHNLKNIDVIIPRNKLTVITGLSGSGKSSLAFDTLYAEGQRRYVESLSSYARQFLSVMEKPEVDHIEGLSPAISIEQKTTSHNPRSTVGTVTEIYDYLRLLFARTGEPRCPEHNVALQSQSVTQMVNKILEYKTGTKMMLLSPVVRERKGEYLQLIEQLKASGYIRARINGDVVELNSDIKLNPKQKNTIEVVIDRIKVKEDLRVRLADSIETAIGLSDGILKLVLLDTDEEISFSANHACPECGYSIEELEPRMFSFNNPSGACENCDGLGVKQFFDPVKVVHQPEMSIDNGAIRGWDRQNNYYYSQLKALSSHYGFDLTTPYKKLPANIKNYILYGSDEEIRFKYKTSAGLSINKQICFEGVVNNLERRYRETESSFIREELTRYIAEQDCPNCNGARLRSQSLNVFIEDKNINHITELSLSGAFDFFAKVKLSGHKKEIADKITKEIKLRLSFLIDVGLEYLNLSRSAETLSGGESQRIRLASQIGAGLVGVMYVLDEPSIGLHQRDNEKLLKTLKHLRDIGNTVIVVEHDEDAILEADHVIDIGPGAGIHGGKVVAEGKHSAIKKSKDSLTGQYLSGKMCIEVPKQRYPFDTNKTLSIENAIGNNLQGVTATIPIGLFTCITGVSGSGKSTLINDTLYPYTAHHLNKAHLNKTIACDKIEGLEHLDKVVCIDQSPIGRTPRSNPATYTGLFSYIRDLFAATKEARTRGYKPGRFSFNVQGGRCETCQGDGLIKVEMHFLADMYVTCDTCKGARYNDETLQILYKGKTIQQVLNMTIEDAEEFFNSIPSIQKKLKTLIDVGLSYIKLGQSATTLSGGEAQRVKLAKELSRRDTGRTLYILDEPTTGLHFHDVKQLLQVIMRLRDRGNTIVIIEHNLDVVKTCDWVIDLGPEGGINGGNIIATGTPEEITKVKKSYTGQFLKKLL